MKIYLLFVSAMLLIVMGCNGFFSKDLISFIPGTYITAWQNDMTTARDTLVIQPLTSENGHLYSIVRRTFYQQTINGRLLDPKYKIVRWTGMFNEAEKTVTIQKSGRILTFDRHKKQLSMGSAVYQKM